jgi:hypothetical protein
MAINRTSLNPLSVARVLEAAALVLVLAVITVIERRNARPRVSSR